MNDIETQVVPATTTPHANPQPEVPAAPVEATPEVRQWVVPSVDVLTRDGDIRLLLDVPGVTVDQVSVEVTQGVLEVRAQRSDQPHRGYRRRFEVPEHTDVAGIVAELAHGVLTLDLPRGEEAKPQRIEVRGA